MAGSRRRLARARLSGEDRGVRRGGGLTANLSIRGVGYGGVDVGRAAEGSRATRSRGPRRARACCSG